MISSVIVMFGALVKIRLKVRSPLVGLSSICSSECSVNRRRTDTTQWPKDKGQKDKQRSTKYIETQMNYG
jgi:hypothetical protein